MKKKLFNLLTLVSVMLIGGANSAWAQTDVTATWSFDLGTDGQVATLNSESADSFYGSSVTLGSNLSIKGTKTIDTANPEGETIIETAISIDAKNTNPTNGTDNIDFFLNPKKGIKFTPKSVSFTATRFGTDGGKINVLWVNSDQTTKEIKTGLTPNRENGNDASKKTTEYKYSTYTYDITDAAESDGICGLRIMIYEVSNKSYGLCNITITGTISGTAEEVATYNITTSVTPENAGSIIQDPASPTLPENSKVTFKATANTGYKFLNKWTVNDKEETGETYTIESLSADVNIVAQFEKLPVIEFAKPEGVTCINRAFPEAINTLETGSKYTLPYNYMYYKEGYTMTGWSDGENTYKCGDKYTITNDAVLTPIFEENTTSLSNHKQEVAVKYDFVRKTNNDRYVNIEQNEDIFITTANVDGKEIDVKLDINCVKDAGISNKTGKVNNTTDDTRVQVNPGTIFTIPVEVGSIITINAHTGTFEATTFNGTVGTFSNSNKTATYTADFEGEVKIIVMESNMYYEDITVTYPAVKAAYTLTTEDTDFYSLYLDYAATIPAGVTAYTGVLNEEETTLTTTPVEGNVLPAGCAVLVKSDAAGEFTFEEAETEAPAVTANDLKGVTEETAAETLAEGKTVLTLGQLNGETGFRNPANGKVQANKAYLLVNSVSAAKGIKIVAGGNTTGITEINAGNAVDNTPAYNVAGQRVTEAAKGLIIKNGKKFMNK